MRTRYLGLSVASRRVERTLTYGGLQGCLAGADPESYCESGFGFPAPQPD